MIPPGLVALMQWISLDAEMPREPVLLYIGGRITIGVYVPSEHGPGSFMDAEAREVLSWPSHWMTLPLPPDV